MTEVKEKEADVIEGRFEARTPRELMLDESRRQNAELARRAVLEFTPEQQEMIRNSIANGMSNAEFGVFVAVCKARKLSPLLKQIHPVKRYDSNKRAEVWTYQVAIDGFRVIAQRTGEYDGQDEPEYEMSADGKTLISCTVRVWRKGISRPFFGKARYSEYVQKTRDGDVNAMWSKMPFNQLAKCAEALALRKAFPEDLSGLYTDEEMEQADAAISTSGPRTPAGAASAAPTGALHPDQQAALDKLDKLLDVAPDDATCKTVARDAYAIWRLRTITKEQLETFLRKVDVKRATFVTDKNKPTGTPTSQDEPATPKGSPSANAADQKVGSSQGTQANDSRTTEKNSADGSASVTAGETAPAPPKSAPKPKVKLCGKMNEDNKCDRSEGHDGPHHDNRTDAEWGG